MRRDRTAAGATLAALGFVVGLNGVTAAAASSAQANAALRYLYAQVGSNGSIAGAAGATEDTIISVADNGYDPATLTSSSGATAYGYLATQRSSRLRLITKSSPTISCSTFSGPSTTRRR